MLVAKYACTLKGTDTGVEGKNDFVVAGVGPTLVKTLPQSEFTASPPVPFNLSLLTVCSVI